MNAIPEENSIELRKKNNHQCGKSFMNAIPEENGTPTQEEKNMVIGRPTFYLGFIVGRRQRRNDCGRERTMEGTVATRHLKRFRCNLIDQFGIDVAPISPGQGC